MLSVGQVWGRGWKTGGFEEDLKIFPFTSIVLLFLFFLIKKLKRLKDESTQVKAWW